MLDTANKQAQINNDAVDGMQVGEHGWGAFPPLL